MPYLLGSAAEAVACRVPNIPGKQPLLVWSRAFAAWSPAGRRVKAQGCYKGLMMRSGVRRLQWTTDAFMFRVGSSSPSGGHAKRQPNREP